ncbi:MAG: hypothetical protein U9R69_09740 [Thermodesulfobacteriota bacterium]|nr:hypothetical protein [Thermodesulfobacteriota bacterium]
MKSQDIFILLKLASLHLQEKELLDQIASSSLYIHGWEGWSFDGNDNDSRKKAKELLPPDQASRYTVRGLAEEIGVGKTEVNNSINRSVSVGLIRFDRKNNYPRPNIKALREFIIYGLKYVFPARPAEIVRGIPTAFAAPILEGQLMTAGETIYVWPDARGKGKGQSITPLFKSVPFAVKQDLRLYEYLALVDAIRLGSSREAHLAEQLINERLVS